MGIRILLVEDEEAIGDFVARGLREEGFTVEWATDGDTGWHHLRTAVWDVILLDWWLPGQDGLTLLKKFRQAGSDTPVLMLTARDAISDRVRGLDGGSDDYLCKPFAFEELLARVRALARRPGATTGTMLAHAGVQMDLATHRAERDGYKLDLTAKEELLDNYLREAQLHGDLRRFWAELERSVGKRLTQTEPQTPAPSPPRMIPPTKPDLVPSKFALPVAPQPAPPESVMPVGHLAPQKSTSPTPPPEEPTWTRARDVP